MANNCGITFHLWFEDITEYNKFKEHYVPLIEEARKLNKGVQMAEDAVYLFDACEDFNDKSAMISLYGWVKWALSHEDAVKWFKEIYKHCSPESAEISYEEPGYCNYGTYTLQDGCLNDRYVDEKDFPDYADDDYWEDLEAILWSDKAIDVVVCEGLSKTKED
jgi:hypothetical protein